METLICLTLYFSPTELSSSGAMAEKAQSHPQLGIYQADMTDNGAQEFSKLTRDKLELWSMDPEVKRKESEECIQYNCKSL